MCCGNDGGRQESCFQFRCTPSKSGLGHVYMLTQSARQGKVKQLHLKTTPFFSREKKSCLRQDLSLRRFAC